MREPFFSNIIHAIYNEVKVIDCVSDFKCLVIIIVIQLEKNLIVWRKFVCVYWIYGLNGKFEQEILITPYWAIIYSSFDVKFKSKENVNEWVWCTSVTGGIYIRKPNENMYVINKVCNKLNILWIQYTILCWSWVLLYYYIKRYTKAYDGLFTV